MLGHCPQPTKQINVIRWFLFYAATCAGCFDRIGVSNYLPRSYTEQLHAVISSLTPPRELVSESQHYTMHPLFFVPEFSHECHKRQWRANKAGQMRRAV